MLKIFPNTFEEKFCQDFSKEQPEYNWQILHAANLFIDGKVDVFGIRCDLDKLLDNIDPTTGEKWPPKHYKEYRFHAGAAPGDVKFLWEYMKHNFLVSLGKAYLLTKDTRYVKESKEFIEKWLKKTPDLIGVSWVGHVHMCQRMVNWFFWLDLTKDCSLLDAKFYAQVDEYIKKEVKLLEAEHENPRNNHKLVSLVTILLCELHFENNSSEFWLEKLAETVDNLIYEDGGFAEQSISYHRLCVEALLILGIAYTNYHMAVPDFILEAIKRSLDYFKALKTPAGDLPLIGDNSNEILIARPTDFWETEYLFQLARYLGISVESAPKADADAYFYLGKKTISKAKPLPQTRESAFSRTGHFVIGNEKDYAFLRAGEFGFYAPNSRSGHPHSHCDQLGVILYLDGLEILTDPGTYRYNENDFERMLMKDESFHSTFIVDNKHQGVYTSSFSYAKAVDGTGRIENGSIVGELQIGGVKAKRRVTLSPKSCLIEDTFLAKDNNKHNLQLYFCLHPRFTIVKTDTKRVVLQHIGSRRFLAINHDTGTIPEILPGYISREYNQALPNQRLAFRLSLQDHKEIRFQFQYVENED